MTGVQPIMRNMLINRCILVTVQPIPSGNNPKEITVKISNEVQKRCNRISSKTMATNISSHSRHNAAQKKQKYPVYLH